MLSTDPTYDNRTIASTLKMQIWIATKRVVIPWCNQVAGGRPWVWQQDSTPAHKSKETKDILSKQLTPLQISPPPFGNHEPKKV